MYTLIFVESNGPPLRYLCDLVEWHPSRPLVDDINQTEVEVELHVLVGVYGQAFVKLELSEDARNGHHLYRSKSRASGRGTDRQRNRQQ